MQAHDHDPRLHLARNGYGCGCGWSTLLLAALATCCTCTISSVALVFLIASVSRLPSQAPLTLSTAPTPPAPITSITPPTPPSNVDSPLSRTVPEHAAQLGTRRTAENAAEKGHNLPGDVPPQVPLPAMLQRMARIRRAQLPARTLDHDSVRAAFPLWIDDTSASTQKFHTEAVLTDVVLALANVAQTLSARASPARLLHTDAPSYGD